ncbi:MAG: hypothetical protein V3W14_09480 [Candidatus Neomarinimicrobiota bacterium]
MALTKNSLLIGFGLWLAGCGVYSFRGNLPSHINSVTVGSVVNQTSEYLLTDMATELILDLFFTENVLQVTDLDQADSDLQVTITRVTDRPATFTAGETVQEWRIDVTTAVVWYDIAKNRPLFEKTFSSFDYYPPGGDIGSDNVDNDGDGDIDEEDEFGDPREIALRTVIQKISEDILNAVISTW